VKSVVELDFKWYSREMSLETRLARFPANPHQQHDYLLNQRAVSPDIITSLLVEEKSSIPAEAECATVRTPHSVTMSTDELKSLFSPNKPLEPDVLSELESIMRLHDLSAEDLFFKWDAYCIKMGTETEALTLSAIRNLKQGIQDSLEKSNNQRHVQVKTERRVQATPRATAGGDVFGMLDGLVPSTPASGAKLGKAGSGMKRKTETPGMMSSPAGGVGDQLKAMNGIP
jgi:hypothetical protein